MNFDEAVDFISEAEGYGIVPGLDSIERLCRELSDPQKKLNIIHIAGTNGKGSTGAFIDSILRKAGYSTGRYISPAVMDHLEIIQKNGQNISPEDFGHYIGIVKDACERIIKKGFPHPTAFEIETAAAFCYFADSDCDLILLEAGMGGKEDATNIIDSSILSVITSISLEHTKFLGNTLEAIAEHKAGIIKHGGNVVTISQNTAVIDVLREKCTQRSAYLKIAKIYNITDYRFENNSQIFSYKELKDIKINLLGKFQVENAVIAIEACNILKKEGFLIKDENIYEGLLCASWPGRFQIISTGSPKFIIDGAHNESAAARLRESIDIYFADSRIVYIMGMFKDKNYDAVVKLTAKRAEKIYTITAPGKRGLDAKLLAASVKPYNPNVTALDSAKEAVEKSLKENCDVIIAFGSLSFLNEIKRTLNGEDLHDRKIQ